MPIFLRALRPARRLRHPRRADVHRDARVLARPPALRACAAGAARSRSRSCGSVRTALAARRRRLLWPPSRRRRGARLASRSALPFGFVICVLRRAGRSCIARSAARASGCSSTARAAFTPTRRSTACAPCSRILVLFFAGHAVLVALRSEGVDLGAAGRRHDQADVVRAVADAGAEPALVMILIPFNNLVLFPLCGAGAGSRPRCAA